LFVKVDGEAVEFTFSESKLDDGAGIGIVVGCIVSRGGIVGAGETVGENVANCW
jgi:hypothetical protein